jgi:hypothetical protein
LGFSWGFSPKPGQVHYHWRINRAFVGSGRGRSISPLPF